MQVCNRKLCTSTLCKIMGIGEQSLKKRLRRLSVSLVGEGGKSEVKPARNSAVVDEKGREQAMKNMKQLQGGDTCSYFREI